MITFQFTAAHGLALLQLVIVVVLPLIVAIVTKQQTSRAWKAILLLVLNIIASVLAQVYDALTAHTAFDLVAALVGALGTFIVGVAVHYGFWEPTTVSARLQAVGTDAGRTPAKHDVE